MGILVKEIGIETKDDHKNEYSFYYELSLFIIIIHTFLGLIGGSLLFFIGITFHESVDNWAKAFFIDVGIMAFTLGFLNLIGILIGSTKRKNSKTLGKIIITIVYLIGIIYAIALKIHNQYLGLNYLSLFFIISGILVFTFVVYSLFNPK